jgi:Holliday junction DNA helicase RuvA
MLASLTGTLLALHDDSVIVQVQGVGFQVFVPQRTLESLGDRGQDVTLFTHLHVRENELALYGCQTVEELELFRILLGVSGIGPRVALSILSVLAPDELRLAIAQEDVTLLARVPGIGPKTARKLVFDLKDKVSAGLAAVGPRTGPGLAAVDADLIAALTALGYSVTEAQEAIGALPREELPLEERVRLALAYFAT